MQIAGPEGDANNNLNNFNNNNKNYNCSGNFPVGILPREFPGIFPGFPVLEIHSPGMKELLCITDGRASPVRPERKVDGQGCQSELRGERG